MRILFGGNNVRGLGTDAILIPGINEIPEAILVKWSKDPEIRALIENGTIKDMDEDAAPAEPVPAKRGPGRPRKTAAPETDETPQA